MGNFKPLEMTRAGLSVLQSVIGGTMTLNFSKVKLGIGQVQNEEDIKNLTDLVESKIDVPISQIRNNADGSCSLFVIFNNIGMTESLTINEIGVFVTDSDGEDVLYSYSTANGEGDWFGAGATVLQEELEIIVYISTAENITANVTNITNAKEIGFENTGSNIISDDVDGALRELDNRTKPQNSLVTINHNLGYYPSVLVLEVNRGAGKGLVGEEIDCNGLSVFVRTRYLSVDEVEVLVPDEFVFSSPELTKVSNNEYIVNFSDTDKSLEIILR